MCAPRLRLVLQAQEPFFPHKRVSSGIIGRDSGSDAQEQPQQRCHKEADHRMASLYPKWTPELVQKRFFTPQHWQNWQQRPESQLLVLAPFLDITSRKIFLEGRKRNIKPTF